PLQRPLGPLWWCSGEVPRRRWHLDLLSCGCARLAVSGRYDHRAAVAQGCPRGLLRPVFDVLQDPGAAMAEPQDPRDLPRAGDVLRWCPGPAARLPVPGWLRAEVPRPEAQPQTSDQDQPDRR